MGDTFVGDDACFLTAVVLIRALPLPLPLRGLRDDLLLLELGPPIIMTEVGEEEELVLVFAFNMLLLLGDETKAAVIVHC